MKILIAYFKFSNNSIRNLFLNNFLKHSRSSSSLRYKGTPGRGKRDRKRPAENDAEQRVFPQSSQHRHSEVEAAFKNHRRRPQ